VAPPAPPEAPLPPAVIPQGWRRYFDARLGFSLAFPPTLRPTGGTLPLVFEEQGGAEGIALVVARGATEFPRPIPLPGRQNLPRFFKSKMFGRGVAGSFWYYGLDTEFQTEVGSDVGLPGVEGIGVDMWRELPCSEAVAECEVQMIYGRLVLIRRGGVIWQLWTDSRDETTAKRRAAQLRAVVATLRFMAPQVEAEP